MFNDDSKDMDFRVESTGNANMLFVDGGNDRVSIGDNGTYSTAAFNVVESGSTSADINIDTYAASPSTYFPMLRLRHSYNNTLGTLTETVDGVYIGSITWQGVDSGTGWDAAAGIDVIQEGSSGSRVPALMKLHASSNSALNTDQLVLDGPYSRIGMGTASPSGHLHLSYAIANENDGILIENNQAGGYGASITFLGKQNFGSSVVTEAGRLRIIGEGNWSSAAQTDSKFVVDLVHNGSLDRRFALSSAGDITTYGDVAPTASGTYDVGSVTNAYSVGHFDVVALSGDPVSPLQAATKQYVDDAISGENYWDRTGTELTPHTAGDSIATTGDLEVNKVELTGANITTLDLTDDIDAAITAATAGDSIVLGAGDYAITADIDINKKIALIGQGPGITRITATNLGSFIRMLDITSSNVLVKDLSLVFGTNNSAGGTLCWLNGTSGDIDNIVFDNVEMDYTITNTVSHQSPFYVRDASFKFKNVKLTSSSVYGDYTLRISAEASVSQPMNIEIYDSEISISGGTQVNNAIYVREVGSQAVNLNLYDTQVTADGVSTTAAIRAQGSQTTVNCYRSKFDGAAYDVQQQSSSVINLSDCTLANGTADGTITYIGSTVAGKLGAGCNPTYTLDINGGADDVVARFTSTDAYTDILLTDAGGTSYFSNVNGVACANRTGTPRFAVGTDVTNKDGVTIYSASVPYVELYNSNTGQTSADGLMVAIDGSLNGYFWNREAGHVKIGTSATERVCVTSTGNVRIGSDSTATSKLDVDGDVEIGSTNAFYIGDPTTDGSWRMILDSGNFVVQKRESSS